MAIRVKTGVDGKQYKVLNGTWYDLRASDDLILALDRARANHTRVRFSFGDIRTGLDWGEEEGNVGYVGRSTGEIKIPLLVYNSRSLGGPALMEDCIVRMAYSNKDNGGTLWQHPNYHKDEFAYA